MIEFSGIEFRHVDNRVMSLKLVQLGLSGAAMFGADGEVLQPPRCCTRSRSWSSAAASGRYARQRRHARLRARASSRAEPGASHGREVRRADGNHDAQPACRTAARSTARDFLARADVLAACGQDRADLRLLRVLPAGRLPRRYTEEPIGITMGAPSLLELFDEKYYAHLAAASSSRSGGCSRTTCKLYVYPLLRDGAADRPSRTSRSRPSCAALRVPVRTRRFIDSSTTTTPTTCRSSRATCCARSAPATPSWEPMVPPEVAEVIKQRGFFGYRER